MRRELRIDPKDPRPIWRQIEEGMRWLVASGALAPAVPIPSVRDLARELQVNPATVSKAYQRLTDQGVLQVRRGEGTFVADQPPRLGEEETRRRLAEAAGVYATLAVTLGAGEEQAVEELVRAWAQLSPRRDKEILP